MLSALLGAGANNQLSPLAHISPQNPKAKSGFGVSPIQASPRATPKGNRKLIDHVMSSGGMIAIGLSVGDVNLTMHSLFPVVIDAETYLKNTLEQLSNTSSHTKQKMFNVLTKAPQLTFESLFWIVFVMLFQSVDRESIKDRLKQVFKQNYGKFFIDLDHQEKQLILERMPFIWGHAIIKGFFDVFQSSRMTFNKQFGLKVFKLVFFELQGIAVSDIFIYNTVNRYFNDDLFSFLEIADGVKPKQKIIQKKKQPTVTANNLRKAYSKSRTHSHIDGGSLQPNTNPLYNQIPQTIANIEYGEEFFERMNKIYNPRKIEKLLQKKNNLMKMHETISNKRKERQDSLDESTSQQSEIYVDDKQQNETVTTDYDENDPERMSSPDPRSLDRVKNNQTSVQFNPIHTQTTFYKNQPPNSTLSNYDSKRALLKSPSSPSKKQTFKLPLDEEYIVNPPTEIDPKKKRAFSLDKPKSIPKRQEVFSCTKLSPFMADLYKFDEVHSNVKIKFNSVNKQIKETPQPMKDFLQVLKDKQKIQAQNSIHHPLQQIAQQRLFVNLRDKFKTTSQDIEEFKKHKMFLTNLKQTSKNELPKSNPQLMPAFTMREELKKKIIDPSRDILFKKQLDKTKLRFRQKPMISKSASSLTRKSQFSQSYENGMLSPMLNQPLQSIEEIDKDFQEQKFIAVNKNIDDSKYRLANMGKFGKYLVQDVYGNMNFDKDKAVDMPRWTTIEEYESEKKKMSHFEQDSDNGGGFLNQVASQKKSSSLHLTKFQLNKTYSMLRRTLKIQQNIEQQQAKDEANKNRMFKEKEKQINKYKH